MTCSKCGKKVRGRPSPTGICPSCRAISTSPPEPVRDVPDDEQVVDPFADPE